MPPLFARFARNHPVAWLILAAVLGSGPSWLNNLWRLYSNEPLYIVASRRLGGMPFSPWFLLSVPVALGMVGLLIYAAVHRRQVAAGLNAEAARATVNLQNRTIQVHDLPQLQRDYGRWHQRVESVIETEGLQRRYPTEVGNFLTLGTFTTALTGVNPEHQHLRSMIAEKVTRLRALAAAVQGG